MDFAGAVDRLVVHATAAGRALPNKITDVAFAHPLPKGRCIRIYYEGEQETVRVGAGTPRVLNGEMVGERVVVTAFWPLASSGETIARTVEHEVRALKHELRTRIQGDSTLNGTVADLDLEYAAVDWAAILGTIYRTLEMAVVLDYAEYPIGA